MERAITYAWIVVAWWVILALLLTTGWVVWRQVLLPMLGRRAATAAHGRIYTSRDPDQPELQ